MRIMLTNDDGVFAPGIRTLAAHLSEAGHELIIVAPDQERSAASHSITLRKDLRLKALAANEYSVDGTPVDCVVIATQRILTEPVDLVISGINRGQNMGEDVLYSGTVAAALEASLFGNKAIAVSINSYQGQNFDTAAGWMVKLLEMGVDRLVPPRGILNINFPNAAPEQINGVRLTTTGHRRYYNFISIVEELQDGFIYRIGGDLPSWEIQKGTDAEAIAENYVSITPLGMTLTHGEAFPGILEWLEENELLQFEKH
ncbi:MAG: 5'/3'-nucleotidase SurE [Candidatus Syntrophosphaera sp.]|nr:5'/3'-nucleotidase SurE [Candidatus Syntrophosphaera sp.]